ncbi:MAG TPA: hypothetical protein VKC60_01960 [Opitutaceae bacterium]|nr:hypothetical protein [Opitutaceae bacterium]
MSTTTPTTPSSPTTPAPSQPNYPSTPPVPITWSASTSKLPAPVATPPPEGSNDFPLTVSNPTDGASVTSPINVVASATPKNPIFFMRVYVDAVSVYYTAANSINTQIFATPGTHTIEVMAEDSSGYISATLVNVTVTSQAQTTITGIQNMPGWQSCSATFPAGSQRAGQLCAAGNSLGAVSTMTEGQTSPSMDGKSAQFSMGGPNGYSNMLYFNPIAGGNNVSQFTYDLYFYIDHPEAAQALEFDLNQAYDDTGLGNPQRWVWGSECNFKGETPGKWDIWDDATGKWQPTNVPCDPFPANTWNHLTWTFERVGAQVHYITLTVNGQSYNVDTYFNNEQGWDLEEIDTAFQMDLDSNADPYNVWLDQVNLTAN